MISLGVPMAVNARKVTDYQGYEQEEPSGWLGLIWEKTTLDAKTFSGLILAAAAVFGISTWRNARVRNAEAAVPVV